MATGTCALIALAEGEPAGYGEEEDALPPS